MLQYSYRKHAPINKYIKYLISFWSFAGERGFVANGLLMGIFSILQFANLEILICSSSVKALFTF